MLSSHLAQIVLARGKRDSIARCALTGVAAYNINNKIIHSLLHLRPIIRDSDVTDDIRSALQIKLRDIRYIIINEKSMISIRILTDINTYLRHIFSEHELILFSKVNVILFGDFAQISSV